jgi:type I restriction enzyme, S subunit
MTTAAAHTPVKSRTLPAGWRWVRLGELIREVQAGFACGERDAMGIVQLRMNNLDTRGNFIWDEVLRVPRQDNNTEPFLLLPGDVLFNNTNSTELVGKSALFEGYSEPIVYSNHFTRLRTVPEVLLPGVLAGWLNHQWQEGVFAAICNRWIGQSAVKADKLLNLPIPLPPLPEQQHIAAVLKEQMAAVDKARAAAEARLEAVKALPAAYLRQVFPKPGQALPEGWRVLPLGETGEVVSGVTIGRTISGEGIRDVPYLRVANVKDGHLDLSEMATTPATADEIETLRLMHGDLLLTEGGDPDKLGRGTVWAEQLNECIHQNHIFRIRLNRALVEPLYAAALVGSSYGKNYFLRHAKQTTGIATINQRVLKAFPVLLPPLSEQRRIAEMLRERTIAAERACTAAEAELATINALPAALLRRAFSGGL